MKLSQYFVTGIDTDIGKTIISAILVEALEADYWKPIQAGNLEESDSRVVEQLISNEQSHFFKECYRFKTAASPHYAANLEGTKMDYNKFQLPETNNNLIVEGAGGLFVPITKKHLIIDLIQKLNLPVVLVSKHYLGSINHTLSSIFALQSRNIPIAGIIFNGDYVRSSQDFILEYSNINSLGNIPKMKYISKKSICLYAKMIRDLLV
jgi:dethiobiotin synthetase